MSKKIIGEINVTTKYGTGFIDEIWISELDFLMIKVNMGKKWVSFNLGRYKEDDNIFTDSINKRIIVTNNIS